jgi:hypothetical protein
MEPRCLFHDAVCSSVHMASNGRIFNDSWSGKHGDGSGASPLPLPGLEPRPLGQSRVREKHQEQRDELERNLNAKILRRKDNLNAFCLSTCVIRKRCYETRRYFPVMPMNLSLRVHFARLIPLSPTEPTPPLTKRQ